VRLPRLYAIVDAEMLASRGIELAGFVKDLRDAGVTLVQYRDKLGDEQEIVRNAKIITDIFRGREATLVMNDSPALTHRVGWNAVHVGQTDAAITEARQILPQGGIVGCSTHTDQQVIAADAAVADYIAIGPVFATSSKKNAEPVVGLQGVRRARALTGRPLVAIGGITFENAASVIEAGADSVAVIGALVQPVLELKVVLQKFLASMPLAAP
jgi:thiamine-phosphate pyrophosphorylase